MKYKKCYRK